MHFTLLVIVAVIGTFITVAGMAPLASDSDHYEHPNRASASYTNHAPIMIMSDADFTGTNGVTDGSGTLNDPYIIENWRIDATSSMFGISIWMTDAYYIIRNVNVYGSGTYGVSLYDAPNGAVEDSLFDFGDVGIIAISSNNLRLVNNTIVNQAVVGLEVASTSMVNISRNVIQDGEMMGLALMEVTDGLVLANDCTGNALVGIMLTQTLSCNVLGNNASGGAGGAGILLDSANDTAVVWNNVTTNGMYGLYLNYSSDVTVYHNRFIDNAVQAEMENCTNVAWDNGYPDGGNYWSNYTGVDEFSGPDQDIAGPDGIGDTPFITNGSGVDRYPWMTQDMVVIPEFGTIFLPVAGALIIVAVISVERRSRRIE